MRTRRAIAIAILLTSTAIPALAQTVGGTGGSSLGGTGGTSSAIGTGGTGGPGSGGIGGGGGGGAGATGGAGGASGNGDAGGAGGLTAGANGVNGSSSGFGGSGGGGGAHGAVVATTTTNSAAVTGGAGGGGAGGGGNTPSGGGGAGGYGAVVDGVGLTYTNNAAGALTGGAGGSGGTGGGTAGTGQGGDGGGGGYGVFFTASGTLSNSGTISGGAGGVGGVGNSTTGANGLGGAGIVGSGITIINSGTITGGLDGDGVTREAAIQFTGGTNTLTLQNGSTITGAIAIDAGSVSFNQSGAQTLSNVITGSGSIIQSGTATLTLSGPNTYTGGTTIASGTLSISSNGNLGTGGTVALDAGSTLAFTATGTYSHAVTLAGDPSFDVASGQTVTYSAVIADGASAGTLEKTDSGTLILTAANTYTGGTTVSAGTLQTTGSGTLGATSGSVTVSGGTLDLGTTTQTQNGGVTLTSGTIQNGTLSSSGTFNLQGGTVSAVLAGTGSVNKTTSGTTTLSGTNTYTGGTTIASGGTLALSGTGSITASSGVADNGAFNISAASAGISIKTLSGSGTVALGTNTLTLTNASGTFSGVISNSGGLTLAAGAETLSGTNTYTGGTTVAAGTLSISSDANLGNGGTVAMSAGTTLAVTASGTYSHPITIAGDPAFDVASGQTVTYSGVIADGGSAGTLEKTDTGTLILTTANTYTGGTTIAAGTLSISSDGNLGNGGTVAMDAGTTLAFTATGTYSHAVTLTGDPTFDVASGQTVTYSGVIADGGSAGTLEKTDSGTLILTAANTYTGGTTINAGTLQTTGSGTLGATSGSVTVSGGTLDLGGTTQTQNGGVTLTSGIIQNGTLSSSGTFALQSGTVSAALAGAGGLTKTTSGTVTLSGANTYTGGTTVSAGTLQTTGSGTLGATSGSVTVSGGTLDLGGTTQTQNGGVTLTSGIIQNGTLSSSGTFALQAGTVSAALTGTGALTKTTSGTVTLSGTNGYTGGTTISAGTLALSGTGSIAASSGVADAGIFDISATASGASITTLSGSGSVVLGANTLTLANATGTFSGVISGTGELTLSSGAETLTGANTYTGTTTISAGTLTVMGSLAGPVTVGGGKLNGTGTVGAVKVASGTFAPGDAVGTMHVNGNLTFASGTTYAVEVTPTAADEAIVSGTASIASSTTLAITQDAGTYTAHDYTLISAASVSGTFTTVTGDSFTGLNSTIQYSATGVDLILSTIPPPAPVTFLFGSYGQTPNQVAVGAAVTAGAATGTLYTTLGHVVTGSPAQVPATLAQLSGDIHASLRSAVIEDGKIIRDTVINHAIASGDTITIWGAGFGAYGTIDSTGNAADVHHNDSGVILGADMPLMEGLDVGLGLALTDQAITIPSKSATASGSTNHVIGYANWSDSAWVASLGWDYGWGANQVKRAVTAFSETDTDHQSNRLNQIFGEVGYKIPTDVIALEPYLDLADVSTRTGAFTETGGVAALTGGARSGSENYATLGVRATAPAIAIGDISMVPDFNLGWQHAFNRFVSSQTLVFAGTGESFTVAGIPLDSDAAAIQAGLDFILSPTATLDIGYDGEVSGRVEDHAGRISLDWKL